MAKPLARQQQVDECRARRGDGYVARIAAALTPAGPGRYLVDQGYSGWIAAQTVFPIHRDLPPPPILDATARARAVLLDDAPLAEQLAQRARSNVTNFPKLKSTMTLRQKLAGAKKVMQAKFSGAPVSEERRRIRLYVCSNCPRLGLVDEQPSCSLCGCALRAGNDWQAKVANLAYYEENLPAWGCKHPGGSRWKLADA